MLLDGRKTIESRFAKARRVPFGRLEVGERIYFRVIGKAFAACATVQRVEFYEQLTPNRVHMLAEEHHAAIGLAPEELLLKAEARFATLIHLADVRQVNCGPAVLASDPGSWRDGWRVLPASRDRPGAQPCLLVSSRHASS